jgi:hypothetical protein
MVNVISALARARAFCDAFELRVPILMAPHRLREGRQCTGRTQASALSSAASAVAGYARCGGEGE